MSVERDLRVIFHDGDKILTSLMPFDKILTCPLRNFEAVGAAVRKI